MTPKIVKNSHILPKNGPNDLKFDIGYIYRVFINSQNFRKFHCFLADFLQKKCIFFADAAKKLKKKLWRKVYAFLGKWSHWAKNWYTCTLRPLLQ